MVTLPGDTEHLGKTAKLLQGIGPRFGVPVVLPAECSWSPGNSISAGLLVAETAILTAVNRLLNVLFGYSNQKWG